MCGIIGAITQEPAWYTMFNGLSVLQHRGQDAAGMMTCDEQGMLHLRKSAGLVRDVFQKKHTKRLLGKMGIGHVRYPTAGSDSSAEAQPFYVNSPYGIALAHNGNLTNAETLREELFRDDLRHMNTSSDSEVLLNVLASELARVTKPPLQAQHLFDAVAGVYRRCHGAYGVVAMIPKHGLLAFRDPNGIRPLVYGSRQTPKGKEYVVASESVALNVLGFELEADVKPGEAVYISLDGTVSKQICAPQTMLAPCLFEFVYLARPDSLMDGVSVHKSRLRMGDLLGTRIAREWSGHGIDVVIPIPDTSRTAAGQVAHHLGVKCREGFIKNRYVGRTFIMAAQSERKKSVRQKLNPIELEFRGKNVLLVDDSIVRGTTAKQIVQMARDAGAKKVYFASAAPPVRYPNVYGIDMPTANELVAHNRSIDEIRDTLGADDLIYLELDELMAAVREKNQDITQFDTSVFDGNYVTKDITVDYLKHLEARRSDKAKSKARRKGEAQVDLPNAV